ncbi:MAG: hypothetical protein HOK06_02740 [Rhodospirillaceae bacterium]|jgi:hypothetical protein|nr:hypothetical protein [Rhodospirillaceae bacterium]MBT4220185.1 hypothetical protein [Rhodospirillaceae bacterium]MBT4464161.1 hypothetical protein [Rhodospirillaceae bacterium]MBT5013702.1 hypothetical protein [Rhodospirillaceae bacterium]MBT5309409.1 hypothetical protein [Rhodospirillaceae bacterium]
MTTTEFYILVAIGVVFALIAGFFLRSKNNKKKKRGKGKKGKFYKPDAYQDMGGDGNDEFQDSDMYAMKEGKGGGVFQDDDDSSKKKKEDEYDSWDNY